MNNRSEPRKLLERYLEGAASPQEKERIEKWYADFDRVPDEYGKAEGFRIEQELRKRVYGQLNFEDTPAQRKNIQLNFITKIAASILLPLLIGISIWLLPDLLKNKPEQSKWIAVQTKVGERKKIILTDGSEIWLNAASRIFYPEKFDSKERVVKLIEGEAFFKIFRNEKHPFRVIAPYQMYTKVLGTSFNISAYRQTNWITVTVTTGKVAVGKGKQEMARLSKGEALHINTITATLSKQESDYADAWTRDELIFNDGTLKDVTQQLSRAYGVSIVINKKVNENLKCRGNFNLRQSPDQIVKILCSLHGLSYSRTKDRIIIKP